MLLEVIAVKPEDAPLAEKYGADRLELCTGMAEGGLTPSHALIKQTVQSTSLPVNVMIRPHASSFIYSDADIRLMQEDIAHIKDMGANGIVLGPLTEQHKINEKQLQLLLKAADGLDVTFHRAFDEVSSMEEALQTVLKYPQITTILTAGGPGKALDNVDRLKALASMTKNTRLTVMPGSGLVLDQLEQFIHTVEPWAIHVGTGVRESATYNSALSQEKVAVIKDLGR